MKKNLLLLKDLNIWLLYQKMCILITYIVNKFNNIYHRAIKMKPVDVKLSINIKFSKKKNNNNKEGPKL